MSTHLSPAAVLAECTQFRNRSPVATRPRAVPASAGSARASWNFLAPNATTLGSETSACSCTVVPRRRPSATNSVTTKAAALAAGPPANLKDFLFHHLAFVRIRLQPIIVFASNSFILPAGFMIP